MAPLTKLARLGLRAGAGAAGFGSSALQVLADRMRTAAGREAATRTRQPPEEAPSSTSPRETPPVRRFGRPQPSESKPSTIPSPRAGARISNPKAARAVRKRQGSTTVKEAEVTGATGHGGTPATIDAENTPKQRATAKEGRQAAPMGTADPEDGAA